MKHVIITGGAGFIGSHLCELLLAKGYCVTAVDNFLTGRRENLNDVLAKYGDDRFQFLEWDVCQPIPEKQLKLLDPNGLFGVLHFACPASPVDFDKIPFEILAVDSIGTMYTIDLALRYQARYLLASTSECYGDPLEHPQKEEYWGNVNTLGPRACYDEAKRFSEAFVSTAIRGVGKWDKKNYQPLNGAMVRIFNTYGPRMRPDDGRVVPELCMQALRGEPLTVHGQGDQTRSFCYVSDLVDGIVKLFESNLKEPVNIGNPIERTVLEFAQNVLNLTASRSELRYLPARQDDPRRRCPDITRAKTKLGWEPKVGLEEGLAKTIEYFKQSL
jgi:dTDP-glucose 4,6-dehydratase